MKIGGFKQETKTNYTESHKASKNLSDLQAGEKFKATILDIKRGEVTIKTPDGNVITAKSLIMPEARIGDIMEFSVQSNKDGQVLLSMFSSEQTSKMQLNTLLDVLFSANILPTDEALGAVKALMDNGLPVDKSTLQNVLNHLKNNSELDIDTLVFMMKENIDITSNNIEQIKLAAQNQNQLKDQINELAFKVAAIDEPLLKTEIVSIFLPEFDNFKESILEAQSKLLDKFESPVEKQVFKQLTDNVLNDKVLDMIKSGADIKQVFELVKNELKANPQFLEIMKKDTNLLTVFKDFLNRLINLNKDTEIKPEILGKAIKQSLFIDIKNKTSKEDLQQYYRDLDEKITKSLEILSKGNTEMSREATKALNDIKENIDFMNNINKCQEFIQIPFQIGNTQNQGDLYVFSDKKGKRLNKDASNVLISLDLKVLGHFEVFINKKYKNICCQFRTTDKKIQALVQVNISKLQMALKQKGYTLSQVMYKTIDEPFNILKDFEEEEFNFEDLKQNTKRYSFDMRA